MARPDLPAQLPVTERTRSVHAQVPPVLPNPLYARSFMRGWMTRTETRRARGVVEAARESGLVPVRAGSGERVRGTV